MKVMVMVECEVDDEITAGVTDRMLRKACQQAVEAALDRFGAQDDKGMSWAFYDLYTLRVPQGGVKVIERRGG